MNTSIPYLIIGNGKLAKHFAQYFSLLKIPFQQWHRNSSIELKTLIPKFRRIIVLINDDNISVFINKYKQHSDPNANWIHCSGLLEIKEAESAHPLMTFTDRLLSLEEYKQISFVTVEGRKNLTDIFPEIKNPSYKIKAEQKALYHAWCVMSGNFTSLLWSSFFKFLEKELNLPNEVAFQYLNEISKNLQTNSIPVTGPIARNDKQTINKHLSVLESSEFKKIYEAFVNTYAKKESVE